MHEEIVNLFCGGINNYTHTSRDVASQSSAKEAANYCSGRFINRADINLLAGFSFFLFCFFLHCLHYTHFPERFIFHPGLQQIKLYPSQNTSNAMPSFGSELQATLCRDSHNVFPPKGGENQGGCEADTKGKSEYLAGGAVANLAEGTGAPSVTLHGGADLPKQRFSRQNGGNRNLFFFPNSGEFRRDAGTFFFFC